MPFPDFPRKARRKSLRAAEASGSALQRRRQGRRTGSEADLRHRTRTKTAQPLLSRETRDRHPEHWQSRLFLREMTELSLNREKQHGMRGVAPSPISL